MRFTDGEISPSGGGSDVIHGAGIVYKFSHDSQTLSILDQHKGKNLLRIECNGFLQDRAARYVEFLEKATQIHALLLSSNETNRIVDVISVEKLPALLHYTAAIGRDSYALHLGQLDAFSNAVQREYGLKCAYIKYIHGSTFVEGNDYQGHFKARIKTHSEDQATMRSCVLHHLLRQMADGVMMDVVSKAYAHNRRDEAELLMKLSSRLDTMGCILDPDYIPEAQIRSLKDNVYDLESRVQ